MNKQQRKQWDTWVESLYGLDSPSDTDELIMQANTYILKLERELLNIKQGKKIAAILMPHGGPR